MPAPKGNKYSPGRPKGSKDKKTEQWKVFSEWFMSEGIERLQIEMASLEAKEFITTVKDLMEYFQPKLARTEMTGRNGKELQGVNIYLPAKNAGVETTSKTGDSATE